jgi:protein SSD1
MTDESTTQNQLKKDDKKSTPNAPGNTRGPKKNTAGASNQGGPRPSSRGSIKKPSSNPAAASAESGSDTNKKGPEGKKTEQRNKNQAGGASRGSAQRKGQPSRQGNNTPKDQSAKSSSPAPTSGAESSEALSSLQRVIADLKTTSPPAQSSPLATNSLSASMHAPQPQSSNLTPNAPIFQPGAANPYQGLSPADAARHRKAASLGSSALSGNFNSFSPHLGSMMEDAEDSGGNASYEDGEIQEAYYQQSGHQPRSQSQSFMAPRFAALAAQQEQADPMGPSGRPQLAPGFMFGARRRGASGPMAPPINEDDLNFQFPQQPQQQPQQNFTPDHSHNEQGHRKSESAEIGGIMAEQVRTFECCF